MRPSWPISSAIVAHVAGYEAMDDATRNGGRVRALQDVVARSAVRAPLLMLVEDMHWATPWVLALRARAG